MDAVQEGLITEVVLFLKGSTVQAWVTRLITVKLRNKVHNSNEDTIFRPENYKSLVIISHQFIR